MFEFFKALDLQLFGDGGGAAGGDGGAGSGDGAAAAAGGEASVVSTPDDGEARLRELGVPEAVLKKRAERQSKRGVPAAAKPAQSAPAPVNKPVAAAAEAAPDSTGEQDTQERPAANRLTWDEIMADPEYNKQMQSVVQARLKTSKAAEEKLSKLNPAIELLARRYGMDAQNVDFDALAKAIVDDDAYYEERAIELGVPVETAKKIDQNERETARRNREEAENLEQMRFRQHFEKLEQQGNELKKTFPQFDLRTELNNPAFARMTSPSIGISVKDAYYAVHHDEIQTATAQVSAQKTAEKMANAIRSGSMRPTENGTSSVSPSVTSFDYAKASKAQRDALKRQILAADARGEKIYPGTYR